MTPRRSTIPDNSSIRQLGVAEYTLRNEKWLGEIDSLEIRVDWDNMVMPPGKAIPTLKNRTSNAITQFAVGPFSLTPS